MALKPAARGLASVFAMSRSSLHQDILTTINPKISSSSYFSNVQQISNDMDYYIDPTHRYPKEATSCPGMNPVMQVLEEVFDPTSTSVPTFKDCVLISLDAEYESHTHHIHQVGLAVLDTREISKADEDEVVKDILSSRLLLFKKQQRNKGMYLFGEPEVRYGERLEALLLSAFTIIDLNTERPRNIVLVGHGIYTDIREIERASGFQILALPMVKAVIDTSPLINRVYNTSRQYHTLRYTLMLLGMYRRNLHTAGNDAMYTLKALLLMFYHYKEEKQNCDFLNGSTDRALLYTIQIEAIKKIGRCNNGINRFAKWRARGKKAVAMSDHKREKSQSLDLLADDVNEEGIMNGLFTT